MYRSSEMWLTALCYKCTVVLRCDSLHYAINVPSFSDMAHCIVLEMYHRLRDPAAPTVDAVQNLRTAPVYQAELFLPSLILFQFHYIYLCLKFCPDCYSNKLSFINCYVLKTYKSFVSPADVQTNTYLDKWIPHVQIMLSNFHRHKDT